MLQDVAIEMSAAGSTVSTTAMSLSYLRADVEAVLMHVLGGPRWLSHPQMQREIEYMRLAEALHFL